MRRRLVAGVIISVLAMQVMAVLIPLVKWRAWGHRYGLWPFVDYPMYAAPHYAGEVIDQYAVIGVLPDGTARRLQPDDFNASGRQFVKELIPALRGMDQRRMAPYVQQYDARHPEPERLTELRLEAMPYVLSRNGVVPGTPRRLSTMRLRDSAT